MKSIKLALGLAMLGVPSIQAALITWSSQAFTTHGGAGGELDLGIIATTGTQIMAENSGGAALTFDGINFSNPTISFGNAYGGFFDSASPLAQYGTYDNGAAAGVTVPLTGLTDGQMYRVQVLMFDGRGGGTTGGYVKMDDQYMGIFANGVSGLTWGNGLLVTGTFTASGVTQNFNLKGYYPDNSPNNMMNGILLHQVPEPGSALLGGIGILALLRRRR